MQLESDHIPCEALLGLCRRKHGTYPQTIHQFGAIWEFSLLPAPAVRDPSNDMESCDEFLVESTGYLHKNGTQ